MIDVIYSVIWSIAFFGALYMLVFGNILTQVLGTTFLAGNSFFNIVMSLKEDNVFFASFNFAALVILLLNIYVAIQKKKDE